MPAVVSAIGAIAGAIGSLGAIGSAIVNLGISFGLSYIAKALAPKPKTGGAGGFNGKLQAGGAIPRSFIFGRYATAGSLAYVNTWGESGKTPNAYLVQVIALSDLPVKGLAGLIVDGDAVTFDPNASQAGKGYAIPEYNKDGKDYLWIRFHDGSENAADTYLTGKFSGDSARPYSSARRGAGIAYAVITAKVNEKLFTGFPAFKFVVDGIPLYDIRNDSSAGGSGSERWDDPATWSNTSGNPAIIIYNLLRGISFDGKNVYGLQTVGGAQLPFSDWAAAANECDVTVTNADTSTSKQYVAGGEIQFSAEPGDEIEALLTACNGRLAEVGGIYKLHVGAAGSAVFSLTDGDIISTDKQTFTAFPGLDEAVNGVTGTFISPEDGWVEKDLPPRYDADYEAEDGGRRLLANVQYSRVTSNQQGQRLMLSALQEERRARKHGIPMPPWALALEPLDFGSFTSSRNGYAGKLFRADRIDISQNLAIALYITETDPADYDYDPDVDELPVSEGGLAIVRPPAQSVRDWAVAGVSIPADGGGSIAGLRLSWGYDSDNDLDIDEVQFEVRLASDESIVLRGSTPFVSAGALDISSNIRSSTNYEARARFFSTSGRDFSWSDWLPATTPAGGSVSQSDLDAALAALIRRAVDNTPLLSLRADLETLSGALASQVASIKENMGQILNGVGARYGENKALAEIAQTAAATANSAMAEIFGTVFASTDTGDAEATMRFLATSGEDGVAAEISLQVRATVQDTFEDAGIIIQAGVAAIGGGSQIILDASRIIFRDSNGVYSDLDATFLKIGDDIPSVAIVSSEMTVDLRDRRQAYQTLVTGAAEEQIPLGLRKGDQWTRYYKQDGTGHAITFADGYFTSGLVDQTPDYTTSVDFACFSNDPSAPVIMAKGFESAGFNLTPFVFGSHPTAINGKTFNPLSVASAGDLLVAFCFYVGYADSPGDGLTANNPNPSISTPAGWTVVNTNTGDYTISQGSGGRYDHVGSICHIIAKRLSASDNANVSPVGSNGAGYNRIEFLRFTGGGAGTPIQKVQGFGSGSQSKNMALSAEQNALIVLAACCGFSASGTNATLTLTAKDNDYSGSNQICRTHIAYKIYNTGPADETVSMNDIGQANNLVAAAYRM